jgi:TP901 family phage tail tape measure protein
MATRTLTYVLLGKDGLTPVVARAGGNVEKSSAVMSGAITKVAKTFALMAVAGTAASVKLAVDFQTSMQRITGLVGVSQSQVDSWSKQILALATNLPESPKALADAMFYVTSAGFRGAQAMNVLTVAARAAAAGLGPTATITDVLTSALKAYQGTGLTAIQVTDAMVAAVRTGKIPVDELAGSIGQVIPLAAQAGVSFQQVVGVAASLSHVGVAVDKSMTGLRYLLTNLIKPTAQANKILGSMGMTADQLRNQLGTKGLLYVMQELKAKLPIQDFLKMVGGARGVSVGLGLVGKNASQVDSIMKQVQNSTGSTNKAFEVASQTAKFKLDSALSALQVSAIRLGSTLLPTLSKGLDLFSKFLGPIAQSPAAFAAAGLAVIGFAAAFKVAMALISTSVKTALITTGIGAAILVIGIAIAELLIHWKTVWGAIVSVTRTVTSAIVGFFLMIWNWLRNNWLLIAGILTGPFGIAAGIIYKFHTQIWNGIKTAFTTGVKFLEGIGTDILNALSIPWNATWGVIYSTYEKIVGFFDKIKNFITTSFDAWWKVNGQALIDIWQSFLSTIEGAFNMVWGAISAVARFVWGVLVTIFRTESAVLTALWRVAWTVIRDVFSFVWSGITGVARGGWNLLTGIFNIGFGLIRNTTKVGWEIISGVFRAYYALIVGIVQILWSAIKTIWNIGFAVIKGVAKVAWAVIAAIFKVGWDILVGIFGVFINVITGRWGAAWADIRKMAQQVWNAIRNLISAAMNAIKSAVSGSLGQLVGFFSRLPGQMIHALGNAASILWNVGKQVVTGLWNGITNTLGNVGNWVKVHIFNPIVGAIKNLFGIHSPSTVMAGLGGHLISGLITGILKANPSKFISTVFGSLPAALGSLLDKGLINISKLPAKALSALGGLAKSIGGFFKNLFGGGGGGSVEATMKSMAASVGWTGSEWNALNYVETREAGYNIHATNPSSGAYGLAQFINGPGEYAQYGGNASTAVGQIIAFFNYIKQRYGSPISAAAHEAAYNWYAKGTSSAAPGWAWVGEKGRELVNFGGGEQVVPNSNLGGTTIHNYYTVEVRGHALASKQEIGREMTEAVKYSQRHGNN